MQTKYIWPLLIMSAVLVINICSCNVDSARAEKKPSAVEGLDIKDLHSISVYSRKNDFWEVKTAQPRRALPTAK